MSSPELEFTGRRRRRIILAASAGNFAEWYDWGVYGVVATIIATQFFPRGRSPWWGCSTPTPFSRSVIWRGRSAGSCSAASATSSGGSGPCRLTILVTCGGTAAMGVLPTYAQIGLVAPVLLVICRMAQSMGAGGEYASAISFVYEHSPRGHRARNVAQLVATTFIGIMTGTVLARVCLRRDEQRGLQRLRLADPVLRRRPARRRSASTSGPGSRRRRSSRSWPACAARPLPRRRRCAARPCASNGPR